MRALILVVAFFLSPVFANPQNNGNSQPPAPTRSQHAPDPQFGQRRNETDETEQRMERERVRHMNKERQQKIKRDTDQLLELATQLKQYVDKSNENVLSLEVVRKAEEIEKLARQVREKMKQQ